MRDLTLERRMPRPPLPPRSEEHISIYGHLKVPVARSTDPAPEREGWEPFFVNVNLDHPIQKVVTYRRTA